MSHNISYNQRKEHLAQFISNITIGPLLAIPVFVVINYFIVKEPNFYLITLLSIFFAGILPIITSFVWIKRKKIEMDMPEKEDRIYPLLMAIISYLLGVIVLYGIHAPPITIALMFCYFSNTIIVLLISNYWKISIHSMGVAGPSAAIIYVFGLIGFYFALIIPLVMWSRLYLKRHSLIQVTAGALFGFFLTWLQLTKLVSLL
jgi:membrane-associated phospholipid phosphatase